MKKLMFLLLNTLILVSLTFRVDGQQYHQTFFSKPVIYSIDESEKYYANKYAEWTAAHNGITWLNAFYNSLEYGPQYEYYTDIMKDGGTFSGTGFKGVLDDENISFIIDGWLYVVSYEPNGMKSHNDEDYKIKPVIINGIKYASVRSAWLYKKNVRTGGDWMKASNVPVRLDDAIAYDGVGKGESLSPYRSTSGGRGKSEVRNLNITVENDTFNVVITLCGVQILYNSTFKIITQLVIFIPANRQKDGSYMFDLRTYGTLDNYPKRFMGMLGGGIVFNTIDNRDNKRDIRFKYYYKNEKDKQTKSLSVFFESADGGGEVYGGGGFTAR